MAETKRFGPDVKTVADTQDMRATGGPRPASDTKRTVAMAALGEISSEILTGRTDSRPGSHGSPSGADSTMMLQLNDLELQPSALPMDEVRQPPEITLTAHQLPPGVPLDPRLILLAEADTDRAAAFRILRHHLMDHGRPQVIVVSSPSPGEGKTTCAVNLALALAECNRARVLLVEATVRRPQLASLFGFMPPWCFAEQLAAHRQQPLLPWSAMHLPDQWLHVAAMNPGLDQHQLLDAPAFAIAMERLRLGRYDHIVVDAPAVLGSAEVNLIQDAADGVILVARAKQTTTRMMRRAVEQLSPTKVIGTVLLR
ncbi:tyrosine-protein kinase family protein [Haliangium sp.]|uniref:tyrosine-protein kinase family protein n=1 Tax=Haliangium sp. TaxID=2663208 RepID=UPI003D13C2E1